MKTGERRSINFVGKSEDALILGNVEFDKDDKPMLIYYETQKQAKLLIKDGIRLDPKFLHKTPKGNYIYELRLELPTDKGD